MGQATLTNAVDAYVWEKYPKQNYGSARRIKMSATGASQKFGYFYFNRPFPLGAQIISAYIDFYNDADWPGSVTLSIQRVSSKWSVSRVNWNNRPGVTGAVSSVTKSGAAAGTRWRFTVTDQMQSISSGATHFGWRVVTNGSATHNVHSAQSLRSALRPRLTVVWSDAPEPPDNLVPSNNRAVSITHPLLNFDFTDVSGDTTLSDIQVQIAPTQAGLLDGTSRWDSGWTAAPDGASEFPLSTWSSARTISVNRTLSSTTITSAGLFDTVMDVGATIVGTGIPAGATITAVASTSSATISAAATSTTSDNVTITRTYQGLAAGSTAWWRVRVRDGAGIASAWSYTGASNTSAAQFRNVARGTLTIVSPPNGGTVNDSTPPVDWTFTGTQKHYQVLLFNADNELIWDTGKVTSTTTNVTIPAKKIKVSEANYTVTVRVWDNVDRVKTPGDPIYNEVSSTFTYAYSATVAPATGLVGSQISPYPWVQLDFSRSVQPDFWEIQRDDEVVAKVDGTDLFVSGTSYRYVDRGASPRDQQIWKVVAVVDGVSSASSPTVAVTPTQQTTLLCEEDGSNPVFIFNPRRSGSKSEMAELFEVTGDASPVLILQQLQGFRGSVEGLIADGVVSGLSARVQRNNLERLRKKTGATLRLYYLNMSLPVIAYNITWDAVPYPSPGNQTEYTAQFDFFEVSD